MKKYRNLFSDIEFNTRDLKDLNYILSVAEIKILDIYLDNPFVSFEEGKRLRKLCSDLRGEISEKSKV